MEPARITHERFKTTEPANATYALKALKSQPAVDIFTRKNSLKTIADAQRAAVDRVIYNARLDGKKQKEIVGFREKLLHEHTDLTLMTAKFFIISDNNSLIAHECIKSATQKIKQAVRAHHLICGVRAVSDEIDNLSYSVLIRLCDSHDFFRTPTPNLRVYINSQFRRFEYSTIRADINAFCIRPLEFGRTKNREVETNRVETTQYTDSKGVIHDTDIFETLSASASASASSEEYDDSAAIAADAVAAAEFEKSMIGLLQNARKKRKKSEINDKNKAMGALSTAIREEKLDVDKNLRRALHDVYSHMSFAAMEYFEDIDYCEETGSFIAVRIKLEVPNSLAAHRTIDSSHGGLIEVHHIFDSQEFIAKTIGEINTIEILDASFDRVKNLPFLEVEEKFVEEVLREFAHEVTSR